MGTSTKQNTKWIIFGSIIFILAVLIAVGPILITKYMRTKWEDGNHHKVSKLLMNIIGELSISKDNICYVKGDNGLFYVLEGLTKDVSDNIGKKCSVIGGFRQAKNGETVDGNPVRLFINVDKIIFTETGDSIDNEEVGNNEENVTLEEKLSKKSALRVEANTRLNKPILFDVVKGKVFSVNRKDKDGKDYTAFILADEFNDNYMLYKKGKDLSFLSGKEIVVLGREIIPPSNMYLVVDESTFEIYEVYDTDYNRLF
jgi:hypothetical protein